MRTIPRTLVVMALSVLVGPSVGWGGRWFVRPAGPAPYGKGDGRSFADAWNGLAKIDWAKVRPDDTLYVCDTHVGEPLNIEASGEEGRRITIRGDWPDHAGAVLGATAVFADGWAVHDQQHNVWKRAFKKPEHYSGFHAFARPADSDPVKGLVRLHNVGKREDAGTEVKGDFAKWEPGTYYFDEDAGTLYFKPPKGSANDYVYYAGYEPGVVNSVHQHHFDLRNLTVMMGGGSKNRGVVEIRSADHVTIDGLTVRWGSLGIVFAPYWPDRLKEGAASEDVTVSNCHVYDCRCGIYPAASVKNCRIADNHVHDIGQHGYYLPWKRERWYGDIHGIAIQGGGNGLVIERNHVHHVGGEGIFPYGDHNPKGVNCKEMRNFRIQYNHVHHIKYLGSPAKPSHGSSGKQTAIYYNQNNTFPCEALGGNVIAYNLIHDAEHGVRMKCNDNKKPGDAPWSVYNNVIYNTDIGVCWYSTGARNPHNKPGIVCKNNIILKPKRHFVQLARPTIREYDQVIFDHNLYWPKMPEGFVWSEGKGDFAAWRAWTAGTSRDEHSRLADPKLAEPEKANFRPLAGSPAIDAGTNVGFKMDYSGTAVPQGTAPDIGAYEHGPQ